MVSGLFFAVIADGFDGAAFHRFFAHVFFGFRGGLFDHKGVAVFRMHAEMVRGGEHAGVASNAFLVDKKSTRYVFDEFLGFIGHILNLKHSARAVIFSFVGKTATPLAYDI
jgi:hypothetical protein